MDSGGKDDNEQEKRNQYFTSTPMSSIDLRNPLMACNENLRGSSSCSSAPMVDPFGPQALWEQSTSVQNMGYSDTSLPSNFNGLNPLSQAWNPPASMLKEGLFLHSASGMLPESLAQFPADSGFIERAARFSCFGGGGFGNVLNPFGGVEGVGGVMRMPVPVHGEVFPVNSVKELPVFTDQTSKDSFLSSMPENCDQGRHKTENLVQSNDGQSKQVVGRSGNDDSNEHKFGEGGGRDGKEEKGSGSRKRKRNGPDAELDAKEGAQTAENAQDINESQQRVDQSPNSGSGKEAGKNKKQGSEASEPPKEEYIHVRARRGQATNSHSLAERVRREKISERMKFLQDLVPGCSKVTGKAVMLDEIINYVQSLQRQVEFLSMKLATVNPRLDFNIEALLAKDILHSRAGPSSTLGFFPDMPMPYPPPAHPLPAGLIQAGVNCTGSPESLRRNLLHNQINAVGGGGFKESSQIPNAWEDELNHVVQMGFNGSAPPSDQDNAGGSVEAGHPKVEL